jgi:hypothetical protein
MPVPKHILYICISWSSLCSSGLSERWWLHNTIWYMSLYLSLYIINNISWSLAKRSSMQKMPKHKLCKIDVSILIKPAFNDHLSYVTFVFNVPYGGHIRQVWLYIKFIIWKTKSLLWSLAKRSSMQKMPKHKLCKIDVRVDLNDVFSFSMVMKFT